MVNWLSIDIKNPFFKLLCAQKDRCNFNGLFNCKFLIFYWELYYLEINLCLKSKYLT